MNENTQPPAAPAAGVRERLISSDALVGCVAKAMRALPEVLRPANWQDLVGEMIASLDKSFAGLPSPPDLTRQLAAANAEIERLKEEAAWVRRKLKLPEDAPFTSGNGDTLAGRMHVVCAHADGYEKYIVSYKCDDKQGEIARLTVRVKELEEQLTSNFRTKPLPRAHCQVATDAND